MIPLSIYIHIPFCIKKCYYCDFLSFPSTKNEQKYYVEALIKEINSTNKDVEYSVISIFIGGGTPSIISKELIKKIIQSIKDNYNVSNDVEITIEVNPGTVDKDKLETYKQIGINRLSIGLQSTDNELLSALGRIHNYEEFLDSYYMAKDAGFKNINIDLMFGLPNQNIIKWENTLDKIIKLNPTHISCYSLIVEGGTLLSDLFESGKLKELDEEIERQMYHLAISKLKKARFKQYEISNFSKEGYKCKHNLSYWIGREYLGIGLGASSYIKGVRYKNTEDIKYYIKNVLHLNKIRENKNIIIKKQKMEEYMFLGLRLTQGVSKKEFLKRFNMHIEEIYKNTIYDLKDNNLIKVSNDNISLTSKGIDLSNYVFTQFLLD
ncbi:MAG: radical SAM family heme chaperone HemW [Eubacteriales bacterium]